MGNIGDPGFGHGIGQPGKFSIVDIAETKSVTDCNLARHGQRLGAFGDGGNGRIGKLEKIRGDGGERQEGGTHAAEFAGVAHPVLWAACPSCPAMPAKFRRAASAWMCTPWTMAAGR